MAIKFSFETGLFEIGHYGGAPIQLHPGFFLAAGLLAFPFWRQLNIGAFVLAVLFMAAVFASILLHELAHAAVGDRYCIPIDHIDITWFGGLVHFCGPYTVRQGCAITIAGPFANLALAFVAIVLLAVVPFPEPTLVYDSPVPRTALLERLLRASAYLNIGLCLFNLIPALPLDGGKLVYMLAELRWNTRTAVLIVTSLGMLFSLVSAVMLIVTSVMGMPIWAPLSFTGNYQAFCAARDGRELCDDSPI